MLLGLFFHPAQEYLHFFSGLEVAALFGDGDALLEGAACFGVSAGGGQGAAVQLPGGGVVRVQLSGAGQVPRGVSVVLLLIEQVAQGKTQQRVVLALFQHRFECCGVHQSGKFAIQQWRF